MTADLHGMKVLVTGGAGFIGSHTVDALISRGARVVVIDNLLTGRRENLNPRARFHELNIADARTENVIEEERPDVIYHFAHYVLVPKSVENPLLDVDALAGSLRIFGTARRLGVRKIIFASSGLLYGNATKLPVNEESPIDPVSPYVVSKHATENYLHFFRKAYGLPYGVLRYSAVYGPRQVTGAMPDYIRKLTAGGQAEIWGDGNKTRDYVFIDDVVQANLLALTVPDDHPNPVYNVGAGVETTLNEIYRRIARLLGKDPRPIYQPDRPGEQLRYCLDSGKARRELRWRPMTTLEQGLEITVQAGHQDLHRR